MEQKTVKLIGFKAENSGIIRAVELTPDLLSKRMLVVVGESGNGKTTLIKLMQTAVSGTDAILSKAILEKGYLTEAQILDGEIKLYVGARVTEYQRGENAGSNKFETFLYSKDDNGAPYTPIIDGVKATAASYIKLLTTDLTFNMAALFTNNQTEHRKLIESLFKPELDRLGADKVVEAIIAAKKHRDGCRVLCQGNGAYMERFEDEGYSEAQLELLKNPDLKEVEDRLFKKRIELDRLVNGAESRMELERTKLEQERTKRLQEIRDSGAELREKLRIEGADAQKEYDELFKKYEEDIAKRQQIDDNFQQLLVLCESTLSKESWDKVSYIIQKDWDENKQILNPKQPESPKPNPELALLLKQKLDEYNALIAEPIPTPKQEDINADIDNIGGQIRAIEIERDAKEATADLYRRYQLWKDWIKAKGLYEKEIDTLRRMYASIDTGVEGMKIIPVETDSDRVEVWITYNGCYDTEFFHNEEMESRFIFQYSSFQCSAIGVMLQAARLNLKPKALRLAIVDDVAFTSKGLAVLTKMCEDFNVQLITSRTDDYDKQNIPDGEIVVEGGEVFFNKVS